MNQEHAFVLAAEKLLGIEVPRRGQINPRTLQRNRPLVVAPLKPDIIVAATTASVIAAKKLTDTIPIVCENLTNPIEFGVAASYARPGSNVTGVLLTVEDLPTKLLALALELIPGAHKIGLLVHSDNPIQPALRRNLDAAVKALSVELTVLEIVSPDDLHAAFQRLARERAKVVLMLSDFMFLNERKRIALFAMAERLPTISARRKERRPLRPLSFAGVMRWR